MHAQVGDRIVVAGATVGTPVRDGEIVEVDGTAGDPPYLVRWSDTGRESLFSQVPTRTSSTTDPRRGEPALGIGSNSRAGLRVPIGGQEVAR